MNNIPGIIGYVQPGAFSRLVFTVAGAGSPGGLRSVAIVGLGRREEYLVYHATGHGSDGLSVRTTAENNYNAASIGEGVAAPNGLFYRTSHYPIQKNQFDLWRNGNVLIRSADTVLDITLDEGGGIESYGDPVFTSGSDYAIDYDTGIIMLAPATITAETGGTDGYFEYIAAPANVPAEVWVLNAISQPDERGTIFSVVGSKSGQIFGAETFTEQRNNLYTAGLPLHSGGIFFYDRHGNQRGVPYSSYLLSEGSGADDLFHDIFNVIVEPRKTGIILNDVYGITDHSVLVDTTMNFLSAGVEVGHYLEFLDYGDPNFGALYRVEAVGVDTTGLGDIDYSMIVLEGTDGGYLTVYSGSYYTIVDSGDVGHNFYTRPLVVYGTNKLTTEKKYYYIRIFGSEDTNLTQEDVYMSPGQALFEVSDNYTYDPVSHTWSGDWYRGSEGTGFLTNETDTGSLGRSAAVAIYARENPDAPITEPEGQWVDSGIKVNFAYPAGGVYDDLTSYYYAITPLPTYPPTETINETATSGDDVYDSYNFTISGDINGINKLFSIAPDGTWTDPAYSAYFGYLLGTLTVYVNGIEATSTEETYEYSPGGPSFVGRDFTLVSAPEDGDVITATFEIGDLTIARMTGFRIGDMWMIEADGKYDNGMIAFSLVSGEVPFNVGDTLTLTVSNHSDYLYSSVLDVGDTLVATYVSIADLYDPEEFFDPASLYKKHGYPSITNTLSLGAELAFANGARSVVACQAKPTKATRTYETLLASLVSENYVGNGGPYYTAHTHGGVVLTEGPEMDGGNPMPHSLMHSHDYGNAMTTLHRHDDTNYANPAYTGEDGNYAFLRIAGSPYDERMNIFVYSRSSRTPRQIFLNRVLSSVIYESTVSIPCTRRFGFDCNKSGRAIPTGMDGAGSITANDNNNPYFLDSRSPYYLSIFLDGTVWTDEDQSEDYGGGTDGGIEIYGAYQPVLAIPYILGTEGYTEAEPVYTYPDDVRNLYSTSHTFPDVPDTIMYGWGDDNHGQFPGNDRYIMGEGFPCGALFRHSNGSDLNQESTRLYTEIDGLPLSSYFDHELAFKPTCTNGYDSVTQKFLRTTGTGYNGGVLDPNDINIVDAMLYMRTQRTDMSYMIWGPGADGTIILSDKAGLRDGEGFRVSYVSVDDADFVDPQWSLAATALESVDTYWICPLPDAHVAAVQHTFKLHVDTMSSTPYRKERQLVTGAFSVLNDDGEYVGLTPENLYAGETHLAAMEDIGIIEGIQGDTEAEILAGSIEDLANYGVPDNFGDSYRVNYFYPDQIVVSIAGTNTAVPGLYLGAAAAGWFSGQQYIAESLTWKSLIGFTITRDRTILTGNKDISNRLGAAGVTVVHGLAAGGKVLHSKTTIQGGSAYQEEPSSINIADLCAQELRNTLSNMFIGRPITNDLPHQMLQATKQVLQSFVHRKLLNNFDNIQVSQDTVEPRQFNVICQIQPVLPLLWIYIEIQVGI